MNNIVHPSHVSVIVSAHAAIHTSNEYRKRSFVPPLVIAPTVEIQEALVDEQVAAPQDTRTTSVEQLFLVRLVHERDVDGKAVGPCFVEVRDARTGQAVDTIYDPSIGSATDELGASVYFKVTDQI